MKVNMLSAALIAALFAAPAMADDSMLFKQSEMVQMLLKYDTNGDGVLSRDEIVAGQAAEFNAADTNPTDSSLSWTEFKALQDTKAGERTSAIFKVMDTDSSGSVSATEFATAFADKTAAQAATVFAIAAGSDAQLSLEELAVMHSSNAGSHMWMFAMLDTDGNSALSLAEYTSTPAKPPIKKGRK